MDCNAQHGMASPAAESHSSSNTSPIPVSTVPAEQIKPVLQIEEDLYLWLVDQARLNSDWHAWSEKVCMNDLVSGDTELLTAVLASETFFKNVLQAAQSG